MTSDVLRVSDLFNLTGWQMLHSESESKHWTGPTDEWAFCLVIFVQPVRIPSIRC